MNETRDDQKSKINYLMSKYDPDPKCNTKTHLHLLSHLIISITKSFAPFYDGECIQRNSLERNELRIPLFYRYTSITVVEELLDWLSSPNKDNFKNWEKSLKIIENEYKTDKESILVYNFRKWLTQNNIPVYEYELSRNCWVIGEGKNKFFLYRDSDIKSNLYWSLSFSISKLDWNKINGSFFSSETIDFSKILNMIMEEKRTFDLRIPIFMITGTNGKTTTARMIAQILKLTNEKVALTTSSGLTINNKFINKGDLTGPWSARNVISLDNVSYAVIETARGGILKEGIAIKNGFDGASIITNIFKDHLGMKGIENLSKMAEVKFQVVDAILNTEFPKGRAIINADDEFTMDRVQKYGFEHFWGFSLDKSKLEKFDAGIYLNDNFLWFYNKKTAIEEKVISIFDIPASFAGKALFNVINAMTAALA
ncbi:MAG: Cyanophycin synthetase, partial [Candidatus Heimdallarchaeota archaeon LC_3]